MASVNEDTMLEELSGDIDESLYKWLTTYEIPALNLTAVMLARLTWLAQQGDYTNDFIRLLESPKNILDGKDEEKVMH
jgi:hypothetical protein